MSDSITARMPAGEANIIALARFATDSAESNAAAAATVKVRLRMTSSLGIVLGASPNGMNQTLGTLVSHTAQNGDYRRTQTDNFHQGRRVCSSTLRPNSTIASSFLRSGARIAHCATTLPARLMHHATGLGPRHESNACSPSSGAPLSAFVITLMVLFSLWYAYPVLRRQRD